MSCPKTKFVLIRTTTSRSVLDPGGPVSAPERSIIGVFSSHRRARACQADTVRRDTNTLQPFIHPPLKIRYEDDTVSLTFIGINNTEKNWRYTIEKYQEDTPNQ